MPAAVELGRNLGTCRNLTRDGRCEGRMLVDELDGSYVIARCEVCGCEAACTVERLTGPSEPVGDKSDERGEQWWQR